MDTSIETISGPQRSSAPAAPQTVVAIEAAAATRRYRGLGRMLESEASGATRYTQFLIKNGRRPDPDEATVMGLLMGCRVRASDLNFYPLPMHGNHRPSGLQREG